MQHDTQAAFCATLVDQWARDGVRHAMVSPGSRSTPMALALADHPDISVSVFHDERSAGFAALGAALVSGDPAIALCTSGTAATHFHAAVVEAHLSAVPMLVLTADRPAELRDVGAPQTIDQLGLYGRAVRWFHDPGVPSEASRRSWRSLARSAFERAVGTTPGPVHLDLPFREPLVGIPGELPAALLGPSTRPVTAVRLGTLSMSLQHDRGLIVAGRGVDDPGAVAELSAATGWPVFADPRSGCRGEPGSIAGFDALLRHPTVAELLRPDVVVHLGEPPASKVTAQWLSALDASVQVRVDPWGRVIDPDHVITHRISGGVGDVCRRLAGELSRSNDAAWFERWVQLDRAAQGAIDAVLADEPLSEPAIARRLSAVATHLVAASSMPVRDLEWFGRPDQQARVVVNRGANGIDGTVATAIGVALERREPVTVLVGDVALLHDSSSLAGLADRGVDVRIVVLDNDGGGIFSFLPQASTLDTGRFEALFGTPHGTDPVALAAAHRLPGAVVTTGAELDEWLERPGPWLVRVVGDRAANVTLHRRLGDAVIAAVDA